MRESSLRDERRNVSGSHKSCIKEKSHMMQALSQFILRNIFYCLPIDQPARPRQFTAQEKLPTRNYVDEHSKFIVQLGDVGGNDGESRFASSNPNSVKREQHLVTTYKPIMELRSLFIARLVLSLPKIYAAAARKLFQPRNETPELRPVPKSQTKEYLCYLFSIVFFFRLFLVLYTKIF